MSRPDRARVARYVVARRGELNMSQQRLAERAGVDAKTIYNLESGDRWPQPKTRDRIEAALGWYSGDLQRIAEGGEPIDYERPPTRRELFADYVQQRCKELNLDWLDIARDSDLPPDELAELRRYWDPDARQRSALERALRWEPQSIDAIFGDGRKPRTIERWRDERPTPRRSPLEMQDEVIAKLAALGVDTEALLRVAEDPERREMLNKFTTSIDPGESREAG